MLNHPPIDQLIEEWANEEITPERMVEELFWHIRQIQGKLPTHERKIDLHGHEIAILEGMITTLRQSVARVEVELREE